MSKLSLNDIVETTTKKEIKNKAIIDELANDVEGLTTEEVVEKMLKQGELSKESKKWMYSMSHTLEVTISGATNKIALMAEGKIPTTYRDMAVLYRRLSIMMAQIRSVQAAAKNYIFDDFTAPDTFFADGTSFTKEEVITKRFDRNLWKKSDPVGFKMITSDPAYKKDVTVKRLSSKAIGIK